MHFKRSANNWQNLYEYTATGEVGAHTHTSALWTGFKEAHATLKSQKNPLRNSNQMRPFYTVVPNLSLIVPHCPAALLPHSFAVALICSTFAWISSSKCSCWSLLPGNEVGNMSCAHKSLRCFIFAICLQQFSVTPGSNNARTPLMMIAWHHWHFFLPGLWSDHSTTPWTIYKITKDICSWICQWLYFLSSMWVRGCKVSQQPFQWTPAPDSFI